MVSTSLVEADLCVLAVGQCYDCEDSVGTVSYSDVPALVSEVGAAYVVSKLWFVYLIVMARGRSVIMTNLHAQEVQPPLSHALPHPIRCQTQGEVRAYAWMAITA